VKRLRLRAFDVVAVQLAYQRRDVRGDHVDEVAPPLFDSHDMRSAVAALLEHGARNFREKVSFQGR